MKTYWKIDETAIAEFDSIDKAVEMLNRSPEIITIQMSSSTKIVHTITVHKEDVAVVTEEE